MIGQGLDMAGITGITPVSAYINSLPFNMYSIFTLIFVGMMMYTGRDYGPMLKAEVRALTTGQFTSPTAKPMLDVGSELGEAKKTKPMIMCFALPIVVAFIIIISGILFTGITNPDRTGAGIMAILDACDAQKALYWGSFGMAVTGIVLALATKIMTFEETMTTIVDGFKLMSMTGAILVLAWSLGSVTIQLGYAITGDITFSTGMTGAVVSGAIFGDHCSPVSDTTVMASIFSGADHIEHVGTQVPYAVTVISVIAVLYVIFGFTRVSPFVLIPIGIVALYFLQIVLHKYYMKKYNIDPNYRKFMTEDHKK